MLSITRRTLLAATGAIGAGGILEGGLPVNVAAAHARTMAIRQDMRSGGASAAQAHLRSHIDHLQRAIDQTSRASTQAALRTEQASATQSLASALLADGQWEASHRTAVHVWKLTEILDGSRAADICARAGWHTAYIWYHIADDPGTAMRLTGDVAADTTASPATRMLGASLLAKISATLGDPYRARALIQRAESYGDSAGFDGNEWGVTRATLDNWTGATLGILGDTDEALKILAGANTALQEAGDVQRIHTWMDQAEVHASVKSDAAIGCIDMAYTLAAKHGEKAIITYRVRPLINTVAAWCDTGEARDLARKVKFTVV